METPQLASPPVPLLLGQAADFGRVRALFEKAQFDEKTISRALGIADMVELGKVRIEEADLAAALGSPMLAVLVRAFLLNRFVPRDVVERTINDAALGSLLALDLVRPDQDAYYAPVLLYPVAGFVIASDRHENPDGSPLAPSPDAVFPAIFAGTLRFVRLIPRSSAESALDLCTGSGIGALVLSRHVERVVAADITARSAHFARFNALLNDRRNVEVAQGDLYDAVAGRTFDYIVAHPPYVPALDEPRIFRDGGETGESVLRRIIQELPRHLRPGGVLYCVSAAWDSAEGPLEARMRRWLGECNREFDVIFAEQKELPREQIASWLADKARRTDPAASAQWEQRFKEAGLESNVYGAIVLRRADAPGAGDGRTPVTLRPKLSPRTDGACFAWAFRWHRWRAEHEATGRLAQALLDSRPRLGSQLRARVIYAPQNGSLAVSEIMLQSDLPFRSATGIEPWMLQLVGQFGQGRTAREVYDAARAAEEFPDGFGADDFATLVAMMIERGYLEVEDSTLL